MLGPPGSGKSTLLRHYELEACRIGLDAADRAQPLTFFVPLNDHKPREGRLPAPLDWLASRWQALDAELPPLIELLRDRRVTLLLDALNEIPFERNEAIKAWREFLAVIADDFPGTRVIFSCRSLDYSGLLSTPDLPVPQLRIEPLHPGKVEEFLTLYDPTHGATLWKKLRGTPQLDLFRLPFYLKLLVDQAAEGHVPTGRAALFTGLVRASLRRALEQDHPLFRAGDLVTERDIRRLAQAHRWKTPHELPDSGILLPKLAELAYAMQDQRTGWDAGLVRIDADEALELLGHPRGQNILDAGGALGVVDQDPGSEEVLFAHQLLQEYFAARRFSQAPDYARLAQAWRADEVAPSLAETLDRLGDADPLPPLPSTGWEETAALAAAMAEDPEHFVGEVQVHNLVLAGRCAAQPDVPLKDQAKATLRGALIERGRDPEADLRARIAAGLALGDLGDPRFERRTGPHGDYFRPPLVPIPGGVYPLGGEDGDDDERPNTVELAPFRIGRFPVTNAEWALFLQAGGYDDERWWGTPEALAWQRGEATAEGIKQPLREYRVWVRQRYGELDTLQGWTSQQVKDWRGWADLSEEDFEKLLESNFPEGRQVEPRFWQDSSFNGASQPVVGISWYEARAYCVWLSAQTGLTFALPSEAQWEAAARGPGGRAYAYGGAFDPACCNTFETHVRRTTPVGIFPTGDTPEGVADLCGNTWDWTASVYRDYPYDAGDGREAESAGETRRVVRGGSWSSSQYYARAAYRDNDDPGNRLNNLGLRVVCRSPIA